MTDEEFEKKLRDLIGMYRSYRRIGKGANRWLRAEIRELSQRLLK